MNALAPLRLGIGESPHVATVTNLHVAFPRPDGGEVNVVRGVSLDVRRGEIHGLVGESGSGKSMVALSLLGLIPKPGFIREGTIALDGQSVGGLTNKEWRVLRGSKAAMVFQDPMTALNPVRTIGATLREAIQIHRKVNRQASDDEAVALLKSVGVPAPRERLRAYPHELSGGQRQRVVIALALVHKPSLIIADEPTTALDTTIQAQILQVLRLRTEGAGVLLITHDLGVAAEVCDQVTVMYAGRVMESGKTDEVLRSPRHPYTAGLLDAIPRFRRRTERLNAIPGTPPSAGRTPSGCPFRTRCARATDVCKQNPALSGEGNHTFSCWHPVGQSK